MRKFQFLLIFMIFIIPASAFASTIYSISNHVVTRENMDGMMVDVIFTDNTSVTKEWTSTSGLYGVAGTGWSLTYASTLNTADWGYNWVLQTDVAIKEFTIRALPGNTVFDIYYNYTGTPAIDFRTTGSSDGGWAPTAGANSLDNNGRVIKGTNSVTVTHSDSTPPVTTSNFPTAFNASFDWTFSDAVNLIGEAAQLDLYSTLNIDFGADGFVSSKDDSDNPIDFKFMVDTDNFFPIPEPATMLLFGFGLIGISAIGRKKA